YGDGSGDGSGYGSGYGSGVNAFNNQPVYSIDRIQTLIDSVHGSYARGRILHGDLTTEQCYIAKVGNFFAHGKRLHEARRDAQRKYDENSPIEERIARFVSMYPTLDTKVMGVDLFEWHHTLTGSCEMGRKAFCKERGIDYTATRMTVREFIELTKDAYGGDNIKALAEAYK
ncbi:MAG: hypothetical protein IJS13_04885, partial [Paludibacteraceae bacterium]|nr:hypothetical protein [Paludibacteraceae bacterium]